MNHRDSRGVVLLAFMFGLVVAWGCGVEGPGDFVSKASAQTEGASPCAQWSYSFHERAWGSSVEERTSVLPAGWEPIGVDAGSVLIRRCTAHDSAEVVPPSDNTQYGDGDGDGDAQ